MAKAFVVYDEDDQFVDSVTPYKSHAFLGTANGRETYNVLLMTGTVEQVTLPRNGTFFIEPIEHEPVVA